MWEAMVVVLVVVIVIATWVFYDWLFDEGDAMHKKPKEDTRYPQRGDNNGHRAELCAIQCALVEMSKLIRQLGTQLRKQGEQIMATLDEILTSVDAEDTVDDSIIALLAGIKAQLDAVLAGGTTPAQQQKIDQIFAKVEASKAKVAAAVVANTPADTEPPA